MDELTLLTRRAHGEPETLRLRRDLTRALRRGHAWVFADALRAPPTGAAGAPAVLQDTRGKVIARGYVDPGSPLSLRICATGPRPRVDERWARRRLAAAIRLREAVVDRTTTTGYRLIAGEGDGLPGLVADRYGGAAVIRLDGPAAEGFWHAPGLAAALVEAADVTRVYQRFRTRGEPKGRALIGPAPTEPVAFAEHGLTFLADLVRGQKTGFFFDQRENRRRVGALSAGRRVLNVFGYTGGFSVYAAAGGATEVTTVDLAAPAIEAAHANMAANGFGDRHVGVARDAFEVLDEAAAAKRTWDLVVLDPPSFAPRRDAEARAARAYERLIAAGARVTAPGGFLVAASCSSHVSMAAFVQLVEDGVGKARRRGTVVGVHGQPADHPTPLPMGDFRYLKCVFLRVDSDLF